jgi:hypothetical protein
MPRKHAAFHKVAKDCLVCNEALTLLNNRDIVRKNFCSRKCSSVYWMEKKVRKAINSKTANQKMADALRGVPKKRTEAWYKARAEHSIKMRGSKCHWWKGGCTPETRLRTNRLPWRSLARKVRERDACCQRCGENETVLVAHHIQPYNGTNDVMDNLVALCRGCHMTAHSGGDDRFLKS